MRKQAVGEPVHLSAERVIFTFSPKEPPVLRVPSGARVCVETRDAYDRRFQQGLDIDGYLRDRGLGRINPATGPIYVEGAEPGDGLDVAIEKIALGPVGFVAAHPGIGVLGDEHIGPKLLKFEVKRGALWFDGKIRLPLRPNVGTIGITPREGAISTLQLGYHGGNLDCNDITEGALLHFPVEVAGGLLAVGDVHASMGYGEVNSGVNIDAFVTLRITRVPGAGWRRTWFETPNAIATLGVEDSIERAIREATYQMAEQIQQRFRLGLTDAVAVTGAACDIRLGQASRFGTKVSAYAVFPKAALPGGLGGAGA